MSKRILLIPVLLATLFLPQLFAEDGMWIPMLLERYAMEEMQAAGCKLTAEDIYSINQDCLKDAVVIFGRGCTGEVVSENGLVMTNHHCGYGAIQSHSTVEHDYLTNGYWAMNQEEEIPNPGLSVRFLRYIKDVSGQVLGTVNENMDSEIRTIRIRKAIRDLISEATSGNSYSATIRPFYYGNQYFMFVYETYRDVRLVGAPPSSIGNFGEDHDNWIWPRHTGDFSLFRIYADENNNPADYDPGNQPYKPRKYFEISMKGIKKGDFTMVMGYPGSTSEYLYSEAVRQQVERILPARINLRTVRLDVMDDYMQQSDEVRIQYASKFRNVSNSWKKWKGMIRGLNRTGVIPFKLNQEEEFNRWTRMDAERERKYGDIFSRMDVLYDTLRNFSVPYDYYSEAVMAVELMRFASGMESKMKQHISAEELMGDVEAFYRDYYLPLDREIFIRMMNKYLKDVDLQFHPAELIKNQSKSRGNMNKFAESLYKKTLFRTPEGILNLISDYSNDPAKALEKLLKDPIIHLSNQFGDLFRTRIYPEYYRLELELNELYRMYMAGLMEMETDKKLYPDANGTMRVTYGTIEGYSPSDGVWYYPETTLTGVMEKNVIGEYDYVIPERLEELYQEKDFGNYGVNGTMPVCFIASNHTSGGNSGSPVINAEGRLIGLNFDRNWEGTMSDIMYDPDICRNISVDIRYVLFIIDKFAGAGYLVDEMKLVW